MMAACNSSSGERRGIFAGLFGSSLDVEEINLAMSSELSDSTEMLRNIKELELPEKLQEDFKNFYSERDYQTAWMRKKGVTPEGEQLLDAISRAPEDGLNSEDYKLQYLYHLKKKVEKDKDTEIAEITKLDKELTAAYLKFASHKLTGRINPEQLDELWKVDPRDMDLAAHLQNALQEGKIAESLQELEPQDPQYIALKKAYNNYKNLLEEKGEWPKLPADLTIKAGDSTQYVATLRERLAADGYAGSPKPDSIMQVYDSTLVKSIMLYQEKNGLEPDGVVGGKTLDMLNTSLKERIDQIQLNLERMRWSGERPDGRYLLVNVPQYMLYIYEGDERVMDMRVIVGEAYKSSTPLFNDTLEYIAFSPTWTVPNSIATEEMLPKLKKNPDYLRNNNFRLYEGWNENAAELDARSVNWNKVSADNFPYRIVQQPGDHNALGHIKFMFPNDLDIYLHDTPTEHLFKRAERDFSHGCIRVERPVDLAVYLLDDPNWNQARVEESMQLPEPENVKLKEKIPVILDYRTAWVDDDGRVTFAKDIYGHDKKQMQRFNEQLARN
ncbi:peptidoglycan binding domain-containing protein [Flammeovirgaceae bacterium 311]|nr:peptidoglycan binding domain-containing protein [Flammeovirgaceae bacterium 311]